MTAAAMGGGAHKLSSTKEERKVGAQREPHAGMGAAGCS